LDGRATLREMPDDEKPPEEDVVLLGGPTDDGEGVRVLRAKGEHIEAGEVRPMKEGKPLLGGEVVKLAPRAEGSRVCDVEVVAKVTASPPAAKREGKGPAQIATREYRDSWERIFGRAPRAAGALN
jgi:hypothetical protein